MSRGRGIVVGGLAGIVLAGCGSSGHRQQGPVVKVASQPPAATSTGAHAHAPPSPLALLRRALSAELRAAGPQSGMVVYDLTAATQLFWLRGAIARPPASLQKLYTTVAVLNDLGPAATLQTTVLGSGRLASDGTWDGSLYVRGGGDPTFGDGTFNRVWEQGYGPTAVEVAARLRAAGIRRVSGRVIADTSLFDSRPGPPSTGFAPDVPDLGGELSALAYDHGATNGHLSPGAFAAHELVLTMRAAGIRARAAKFTASAPAGARLLATVSSPPVSVLVRLMDVPSDDFFAEMLTKQLGVRFGGAGSTLAGATVISVAIGALGIHPAIVDGSGLSRSDRSSPAQVVELLRVLWGTATGAELERSLPLLGVSGTARRIALRTRARGRCSVKTGTLDYVSNLAGYCHSAGGHVLAFAAFIDGPDNTRGFALIGRMAAAIARY